MLSGNTPLLTSSLVDGMIRMLSDGSKHPLQWSKVSNDHMLLNLVILHEFTVSHHPPISAFFIQIPSIPVPNSPVITVQGHCGQKTVFSTSTIKVTQIGRARITITRPNQPDELYTIHPLPELQICGLLTGSIFLELIGKCKITSSLGSVAEIDFVPRGWFGMEHFAIKGHVKASASANPAYTLGGYWTTATTYTSKATGEEESLFDVEATPAQPCIVHDISEQTEKESQRVWSQVSVALSTGNYGDASKFKQDIEETQRSIRRERKEKGEYWNPALFEFVVPTSPSEQDGVTARDPQQSGEASEKGHWIYRDKK
jgi:oxysterol-binding protein-related protein 9/10/11